MSSPPASQPPPLDAERPLGAETPPRKRHVSVQEGYRLWAATYDHNPNPLLALEERELGPLLLKFRGKRILDVGCGTGRWLQKLTSAGIRTAVGVDLSAAMLDRAAQHPEINRRLIRADCQALPIRSSSADLIVCSFTLGHVPRLDVLVSEFSRVALPGADVFVTDLHPQAQALGWRVGFRSGEVPVEVESCRHPCEEVRQSFGACGFKLIEMRDLHLGAPEQPIFVRAGRERAFEQARAIPAVLLCHFQMH